MKTQSIINRFKKNGYKVAKSMNGNVVVTSPSGFAKSFESYAAAHRYYF